MTASTAPIRASEAEKKNRPTRPLQRLRQRGQSLHQSFHFSTLQARQNPLPACSHHERWTLAKRRRRRRRPEKKEGFRAPLPAPRTTPPAQPLAGSTTNPSSPLPNFLSLSSRPSSGAGMPFRVRLACWRWGRGANEGEARGSLAWMACLDPDESRRLRSGMGDNWTTGHM